MCEVIVLHEGFSTQIDDVTMDANCSCILIKGTKNIIVDTMTAWDGQDIVLGLANYGLTPDDINYVVCTHSHADHIGNNNLFIKAEEHIVGTTVHQRTLFHERDIKNSEYEITERVKVVSTPGHTAEDVSVIVKGKYKDKDNVVIAITGDLFEKEDDVTDPKMWINLGTPELKEVQALSRCNIANIVDVIIPGHGPPFHVTTEIREEILKQLYQIKLKEI